MVNENLLFYFPARTYNDINDLAERIMNPVNCLSSTVTVSTKDNFKFSRPEPIHLYTDTIIPNLFGDSNVRTALPIHQLLQ